MLLSGRGMELSHIAARKRQSVDCYYVPLESDKSLGHVAHSGHYSHSF